MSEDVLVKWKDRLEWAATWAGYASNFNKSEDFHCINQLAAEVRRLREKVVALEADKRFLNESVVTAGLLTARVDHLQADVREENRELHERLALQEPDATLGRLVREMPKEYHLIHTVYGTWWFGRNVRGEFGKSGDMPEAALSRLVSDTVTML